MLDPDLKQDWIDALRSGEYEQTEHQLRDSQGYCCLGVLCTLLPYVRFEDDDSVEGVDGADGGHYGLIPKSAADIAGLTDDAQLTLSGMNDAGDSFTEIAKYIERNL